MLPTQRRCKRGLIRIRGLVPLGWLVTTGACTLVLDTPGELAATCPIEAPDGPCGSCIVAACQPLVDACCGDATCAPLLDSVDDCASEYDEEYPYGADAEACRPLTTVDEDPGAALKSCIAKSCSVVCGLGEIESEVSASTCSNSYVNGCECTGTGEGPGNLAECSAPSTGGVCCAYQAYPEADTRCGCRWWGCRPTADGCTCSTSSEGSDTRCDGTYCCQSSGGECSCGPTPCSEYDERVAACVASPSTLGCRSGENVVSSCTARRM